MNTSPIITPHMTMSPLCRLLIYQYSILQKEEKTRSSHVIPSCKLKISPNPTNTVTNPIIDYALKASILPILDVL